MSIFLACLFILFPQHISSFLAFVYKVDTLQRKLIINQAFDGEQR